MEDGMYGLQYVGDEVHGTREHHQFPPPLTADDSGQHYQLPHHHEGFPLLPVAADLPAGSSSQWMQQLVNSSAVSDAASGMAVEMEEECVSEAVAARAKIAAHPLYPKLLQAYIDCQKVGAPPEVANILDKIQQESEASSRTDNNYCLGADPELDEFMEAYCDILVRYKSDLSQPFEEATSFLKNVESQLNTLCNGASTNHVPANDHLPYYGTGNSSSEDDLSGGEIDASECYRTHEERELIEKLMRKYSGYISALKQEFSKKKKRGKLPKEARDVLLQWWNLHYKWPYPTEVDKVLLAESTGLDQKQINNWFINQRKRHWKPSDGMHFSLMESLYGPFFPS